MSYEEVINVEIRGVSTSQSQFQCIVPTHAHRLWIHPAKCFCESTSENANLSLGTAMGFSYCVHLVLKPKT